MAFPGKTSKYAPGVSTAKGKAEARKASRAEKRAQRMEDFKTKTFKVPISLTLISTTLKDIQVVLM